MALLTNVHLQRLKALHRVTHVLQGEDPNIVLLSRSATGSFDELLALDLGWSKQRTHRDWRGFRDEDAAHTEEFQIAEELLDADTVKQLVAVRHQTTQYTVKIAAEPSGLERYWRLQILSVEEVAE